MSFVSKTLGWFGQLEAAIRMGFATAKLPEVEFDKALDAFVASEPGQAMIQNAAQL